MGLCIRAFLIWVTAFLHAKRRHGEQGGVCKAWVLVSSNVTDRSIYVLVHRLLNRPTSPLIPGNLHAALVAAAIMLSLRHQPGNRLDLPIMQIWWLCRSQSPHGLDQGRTHECARRHGWRYGRSGCGIGMQVFASLQDIGCSSFWAYVVEWVVSLLFATVAVPCLTIDIIEIIPGFAIAKQFRSFSSLESSSFGNCGKTLSRFWRPARHFLA